MKTIQLTLLRSTIIDAVKSETLITANADRAADEKASRLAYNEAAGDDDFHERKLQRCFITAAEELKTAMSDYVAASHQSSSDNAVLMDFSDNAAVKIRLFVSDRFNDSYVDSLARLGSDFIINKMIMLWWDGINPNRAQIYLANSERTLGNILRCFNKMPPKPPVYPYTKNISVPVSVSIICNKPGVLSYSIDKGAIDDIEASSLNNACLRITDKQDGKVSFFGIAPGIATLQLFSRHDTSVKNLVIVKVEHDEETD